MKLEIKTKQKIYQGIFLYSLIFFVIEMPLLIKMVIFLVITGVAVTMVYLLIQRNRELQEEEDDDISKY